MPDPRLAPLVLSEDERHTLENWARRRSTAQGLALRARIVLASAEGGQQPGRGRAAGCQPQHGDQVAGPVPGPPAGRAGRRAASGSTAHHYRRPGGGGDDADLGRGARRGPRTGPSGNWPGGSGSRQPAVHRIWRAFGPAAIGGPRPSRSPRTRCSSTRSATWWGCTWPLRRTPWSSRSTRSRRSRPCSGPRRCCRWCQGTPERRSLRLRPARHHRPVRRAEHRHRQGDRPAVRPAPGGGLPGLPR